MVCASVGKPGLGSIFWLFWRLGCSSFGGPVAHLGYFHEELVKRRAWLSEQEYIDLVALCQFLPGPASSQVGLGLGYQQRGYGGALAAWLGFTLPSALLMLGFAVGMQQSGWLNSSALQGLKIVAMAVVIQAVWQMGRKLCATPATFAVMLVAVLAMLLIAAAWMQWAIILGAAVVGYLTFPRLVAPKAINWAPRRLGWPWLLGLLVIGMSLYGLGYYQGSWWYLSDVFFRTGATVFGGGHVVLPMLQSELISQNVVRPDDFLAGYGLAQGMPGPLFTFAAFLGAVSFGGDYPLMGAAVALVSIFAPSFLLVFGVLPYWQTVRQWSAAQAALTAVNAAVVGLLVAALYRPVFVHTIQVWTDGLGVGLA